MHDTQGADASLDEDAVVEGEPIEAEAEVEDQETEATEPESEAESPPADDDDVDEKSSDSVQGRIDELTRKFRDAERLTVAQERELAQLRKQLAQIPKAPPEPVKKLADFDYDQDAYSEYLFTESEKRAMAAAERVAASYKDETAQAKAVSKFEERQAEFVKDHPDYPKLVQADDLSISMVMADEIRSSEIGPALAYHLGSNPKLAAEIAGSTEREQIRRMAILETKLQTESSKAKPNKVSKAPPPPSKIKASEPGLKVSTTDPASDDLTDEEWFKREEARKAKLRG